VLKFCVEHDCGLEAASIEEVHLALAANCEPQRIVFDSPAKTIEEIRFCLEKGIHLNVNEFPELGRIAAIYDTSIHLSNVGIRINPEISAGRKEIKSLMPFVVLNGSTACMFMLDHKASHWTNCANR